MNALSLKIPLRQLDTDYGDIPDQYGALPWRTDKHGRVQVLLVTSNAHDRWSVPKRPSMKDRASYLAAALEAFKEAGVIGEIQTHPIAVYQCPKAGQGEADKSHRVALFALRVHGTLIDWRKKDRTKRKWFALDEAVKMVDEVELSNVLTGIQKAPHTLERARITPRDKPS